MTILIPFETVLSPFTQTPMDSENQEETNPNFDALSDQASQSPPHPHLDPGGF